MHNPRIFSSSEKGHFGTRQDGYDGFNKGMTGPSGTSRRKRGFTESRLVLRSKCVLPLSIWGRWEVQRRMVEKTKAGGAKCAFDKG